MKLDKGRHKILLHLESQNNSSEIEDDTTTEVPYSRCQKGIGEAVGLSRPRVSQIIGELTDKGWIKEEISRVRGLKRRRKVYFLTPTGFEKAKNIKDKLEKKKVRVKTESSDFEIELGDINSTLNLDILDALNKMENDLIDLTKSEDIREPSFTGRDEELKFLSEKLEQVKENGSTTVFIKGEAGIGKTSLLKEFKRTIISSSEDNIDFLVGNGHHDASEPYLPFKEVFKKYKKEKSINPLTFFEHPSNEIRDDDVEFIETQRSLMFSKTIETIKEIAKERTLVICIDDLHWVDRSSLILFHYLADNLGNSGVLLIGTYRPEDVDSDDYLKEILNRMSRQHLYEEIELEKITWEDMKKTIQDLLGDIEIPEDFTHLIYNISEGNPLFGKELVKQMIEDDKIIPNKNEFPLSAEKIDIPDVINSIIENRLKKLDKECLRILEIGSVIGDDIEFDLLRSITDYEPFDLLEHIEILIDLNLLETKEDEDLFRFSHGLIQMTTYENIAKPLRKQLHGQVAEHLEDIFSEEIENYYFDIGYHYQSSGEHSKAFEYLFKAGEKAEDLFAYEDALDMFEKCLELGRKATPKKNIWKVLEKIGDVNSILGNYDDSLKNYNKILAEDVNQEIHQRIYRKKAYILSKKTNFSEAEKSIKKGLKIQTENNEETSRLLYRRGLIEMRKGRYDLAEKYFSKSLKLAKKYGKKKDIANAYHVLGTNFSHKGKYDKALEFIEKGLEIRKEIDSTHGKAFSYSNIGGIYLDRGEIDKALDNYRKSKNIFKKIGDKGNLAMLYTNLGNCHMRKGELDKAYKNHKKSYDIFEDIGNKRGVNIALNNLGNYYLLKGEFEKAEKYYMDSLKMSEDNDLKFGIAIGYNNLGTISIYRDDKNKGKEFYEKSYQMCEEIGEKKILIHALSGLSEVYLDENTEKAIEYAERGLDVSKKIGAKVEEGIIHGTLGKLFRDTDIKDKSVEHFEEGKKVLEKTRAKTELAKLLFEYAMLWKKEREDDKYREMLKNSYTMFNDMSMNYWIKKCQEELNQIS